MVDAEKLLRTIQSELPLLRIPKRLFQHYSRKLRRIPHDNDFNALRHIPALKSDLFLDIGANHGQSIASIRLFRPTVKLIAFEPNPTLAAKLGKQLPTDPNLEIRPFGLSSENGRFDLHVPVYNGWVYDGLASMHREEAQNWINPSTIYRFRPALLTLQSLSCAVQTLDAQNLSPTFLKIDVQGFEFEVVSGGLETIRRCNPIIMLEDFGPSPLSKLIAELGYRVCAFENGGFVEAPTKTSNTFLIPPTRSVPGVPAL